MVCNGFSTSVLLIQNNAHTYTIPVHIYYIWAISIYMLYIRLYCGFNPVCTRFNAWLTNAHASATRSPSIFIRFINQSDAKLAANIASARQLVELNTSNTPQSCIPYLSPCSLRWSCSFQIPWHCQKSAARKSVSISTRGVFKGWVSE